MKKKDWPANWPPRIATDTLNLKIKDFLKEELDLDDESIISLADDISDLITEDSKDHLAKPMDNERLKSFQDGCYLTVGKLKEQLYKYPHSDALVMIERVGDSYYRDGGWESQYKKGYHWHNTVSYNKKMEEEITRRERGEEPEYPNMKDPSKYIFKDESQLVYLMEQYHPAFCATTHKDEEHLYINLHY